MDFHFSLPPRAVPRRACPSRGGPIHPESGLSIPRRAYPSRGGPIHPEAGLSVPRRAYLFRGGPIHPDAGLSQTFVRLRRRSVAPENAREFTSTRDFRARPVWVSGLITSERYSPRASRKHRDARGLYRGTSLIRKRAPLGPYSRTMPRALWWPYGGLLFLMSEVPL